MYKDKVVLVTGGTGSWGNELCRQLLEKDPREIRIYSRNELSQVNMSRKFNDSRLKFYIGDIRDFDALEYATRNVDYIFHLAALKHVPICEEQPQEANKTNIIGTINLINASIQNNVKKVVDVSSDKAVDPLNLYGLTKAVGEKLIIQANKMMGTTRFVCIRAGNVLGSNGSVVPFFIDQIKKYNRVPLTDEAMTRFFMTLPEAISLLFKAAQNSYGGETFVMKMPACLIKELAQVLAEEYGDSETKTEVVGRRPGEKVHEVLLSRYESETSYCYDDNYFLIIPTLKIEGLAENYDHFRKLKKVDFVEYSSGSNLMNKAQIKELLGKGGFLK